jgi:hypothetical protein
MATGPYNLPQGITIDGQQSQAVPRKVGAYDTEVVAGGVAFTAQSIPLVLFQNAASFSQPTSVVGLSKTYGRDVNITSRTGGMAKGERLYTYGITAKVLFGELPAADLLNAGANQPTFAQFLQYWQLSDIGFNLGTDEFIRVQARDVPLWAPNPTSTTTAATTVFNLCSDGMYDLTIAGDPYVLDQQEDFRININTAQLPAQTPTLDWFITIRLEGIRLKSLRQ